MAAAAFLLLVLLGGLLAGLLLGLVLLLLLDLEGRVKPNRALASRFDASNKKRCNQLNGKTK